MEAQYQIEDGLVDDILKRCTNGAGYVRFGNWKILWTGWKASQWNIDLGGQWVAVPTTHEGEEDVQRFNHGVLCVSGNQVLIYRKGEEIVNENQIHALSLRFGVNSFCCSIKEVDSYLEPERRVMCRLLIEAMCEGGIPKWERMSPETRLYSDAERYINERGLSFEPRTYAQLKQDLLGFPVEKCEFSEHTPMAELIEQRHAKRLREEALQKAGN